METHAQQESKENKKTYWLITLVSFVACILFIVFQPAWFWVTLPFLFTYLVKALGMI